MAHPNDVGFMEKHGIACNGCDPTACDLDCPLIRWPDEQSRKVRKVLIVEGGLSEDKHLTN